MPALALKRASVRQLALAACWLLAPTALVLLTTCSPPVSELAKIQTTGVLRMATVNSSTTYYLGAQGATGFEYDLGRLFARSMGVRLQVVVVANRDAALQAVRSGRAQFAAGLAPTPARRRSFRFPPPYYQVSPQVVVHSGRHRPHKLSELKGKLTVPAHTAIAAWLTREHPDLDVHLDPDANREELLNRVAHGDIEATIADSNLIKLNQRYYPSLRVAFSLELPQALAWAFPRERNDVVFNKAVAFFAGLEKSQRMVVIRDRYFGQEKNLGFVGGKTFARIVQQRLHRWRPYFKQVGKKLGLDWRLLAAIGYQESHWDADAVSPTGVRGLMMLTTRTANEVGIDDRTNPKDSIAGGGKYLKYIRAQLPDSIKDPDRTWMALAAYNIGLGHVLDARQLLQAHGRNPDRWVNMRTALTWLTEKRYLQHTRYGYARGHVAVTYVGNIRAYYDILLWMTGKKKGHKPAALAAQADKPESPEQRALDIDIPTL